MSDTHLTLHLDRPYIAAAILVLCKLARLS